MEDIIEQLVSAFNDFSEDKDEFGIYADMQQMGIEVTKEAEISGELHKLAFRSCIIGIIQELANCDSDIIAELVENGKIDEIIKLIKK